MGQMPACVLANAYFGVYDDRVNRVTASIHQIFGKSIKINRCASEMQRDGMDLRIPSDVSTPCLAEKMSGCGPRVPARSSRMDLLEACLGYLLLTKAIGSPCV